MYSLISLAVTIERIIRITTRYTADSGLVLLENLSAGLLYILQIAACAGALGHAI